MKTNDSSEHDDAINLSDIPETTEEQWRKAVRGKHVRQQWLALPPGSQFRITIPLDVDVLEWFWNQANAAHEAGGHYVALINQALREHMLGMPEAKMRHIAREEIREELQRQKRAS